MGSPGRAPSHVFHILRRSELSAAVRSMSESRQVIFTNAVVSAFVGLSLSRPCSADQGPLGREDSFYSWLLRLMLRPSIACPLAFGRNGPLDPKPLG